MARVNWTAAAFVSRFCAARAAIACFYPAGATEKQLFCLKKGATARFEPAVARLKRAVRGLELPMTACYPAMAGPEQAGAGKNLTMLV